MCPVELSKLSPVPKLKLYFTASVAVAVTEICPDPSPLGFWVVDPIISISIWRFDGYIFSGLSISSIYSPLPEPEQDTSSAKIEKIKNLIDIEIWCRF